METGRKSDSQIVRIVRFVGTAVRRFYLMRCIFRVDRSGIRVVSLSEYWTCIEREGTSPIVHSANLKRSVYQAHYEPCLLMTIHSPSLSWSFLTIAWQKKSVKLDWDRRACSSPFSLKKKYIYIFNHFNHNRETGCGGDRTTERGSKLSAPFYPPNHDIAQKTDHNTGNYMPYSLRQVCGFFYVPQDYGHWRVVRRGLRFIVLIREN